MSNSGSFQLGTIEFHVFDAGIGFRIEYGAAMGFGLSLTGYPLPKLGMKGNLGINRAAILRNFGTVYSFRQPTSQYHFRPNIKFMFEKNCSTFLTSSSFNNVRSSDYTKSFYGMTTGIGLEIMLGKNKRNGLDLTSHSLSLLS
jgi:hypothetical protein